MIILIAMSFKDINSALETLIGSGFRVDAVERIEIEPAIEPTTSIADVGKKHRFLAKPIHVEEKNIERLAKTDLREMVLELVKNAIEYGDWLNITFDDEKGEIVFANVVSKGVEKMTFKDLYMKFTTYYRRKDTEDMTEAELDEYLTREKKNFNEGLTTLLLSKAGVRVGDLYYELFYSGEGYFQDCISPPSSHYVTRDDADDEGLGEPGGGDLKFVRQVDYPFTDEWRVTIFTHETEEQVTTKMGEKAEVLRGKIDSEKKKASPSQTRIQFYEKELEEANRQIDRVKDFHEKVKNETLSTLNYFHVPDYYEIRVNGKLHDIEEHRVFSYLDRVEKRTYFGRDFYTYIDFPIGTEEDEVFVLWQLAKEDFYQIVRNKTFYNKNVVGVVILTDIRQFAGDKRESLSYFLEEKVADIIEDFVMKNAVENDVKQLLKNYSPWKVEMVDYIASVTGAYKYNIRDHFFSTKEREENMVASTNFVTTLREAFVKQQPSNRYEDLFDGYYQVIFSDPRLERRSPRIMEPDEFKKALAGLDIVDELLSRFGDAHLGYLVLEGEMKPLVLKDADMMKKYLAVDPEYVELSALLLTENKREVLHPNFSADFLLDVKYIEEEEITELERARFDIKSLEKLEGYNLNNKNEVIEEEIEKIEEEEGIVEEQLQEVEEDEKITGETPDTVEKKGKLRKRITDLLFSKLEKREDMMRNFSTTCIWRVDDFMAVKEQMEDEYDTWRDEYSRILDVVPELKRCKSKFEITLLNHSNYKQALREKMDGAFVTSFKYTDPYAGTAYGLSLETGMEKLDEDFKNNKSDYYKAYERARKLEKDLDALKVDDGKYDEEATSEETGRRYTPATVVRYKNDMYILEILEMEDPGTGEDVIFPFFFNNERDWEKWKEDGELPPLGFTKRRYDAISKAVTIIADLANIEHDVFLVWYYNSDKKHDKQAFYVKEHGIVAVNGYYLREYMSKLTKINKAMHVIDLVAHELTHDKTTYHSASFVRYQSSIIHECRMHKVDLDLRDILA